MNCTLILPPVNTNIWMFLVIFFLSLSLLSESSLLLLLLSPLLFITSLSRHFLYKEEFQRDNPIPLLQSSMYYLSSGTGRHSWKRVILRKEMNPGTIFPSAAFSYRLLNPHTDNGISWWGHFPPVNASNVNEGSIHQS